MMTSRRLIALAVLTVLAGATRAASFDLDSSDYEVLVDEEKPPKAAKEIGLRHSGDVRCYCNQPECVSQGYMCRGKGCFTELPMNSKPSFLKPEHSAYSGCLEKNFREEHCPSGFLCCKHDLCNHIDSPAMRNRLNKTLQVLIGDQTAYLGSSSPTGQSVHPNDGWFKTATIAVLIGGLIVLLILASLAIRLLQPVSPQNNKLSPHRTAESAPPLLGSPKVPLV